MPSFEKARETVFGDRSYAYLLCGQHPKEAAITSIIDAIVSASDEVFLTDVISDGHLVLQAAVKVAHGQFPIFWWTYVGNIFQHNADPAEFTSGAGPKWKDEERFTCELRFASQEVVQQAFRACLDAQRARFPVDLDIHRIGDPIVHGSGHIFPVRKNEVLTIAMFGLEAIP